MMPAEISGGAKLSTDANWSLFLTLRSKAASHI